jgi:hypothetical protein
MWRTTATIFALVLASPEAFFFPVYLPKTDNVNKMCSGDHRAEAARACMLVAAVARSSRSASAGASMQSGGSRSRGSG